MCRVLQRASLHWSARGSGGGTDQRAAGRTAQLTVCEYEACERELLAASGAPHHTPTAELVPGLYERHYEGQQRLVFTGTRDYFRGYAWS